jgi:hypothetical protein
MNIFKFKKLKNWKIVLVILLGITILGIGQIKIAHAWSLFSIADITANAISAVAQAIGFILGFIAGVFIAIAGYLVTLALNINFALLKSPVVQTGWQIVLNFTNLGFVLAIIVMAFATIFRVQTYAMKQTLWKLIVAALLVNFSLVIAGAFINISDIFSNFFLKQGGIKDPLEWSKAFAAMFRAQALLKVGETFAAKGFVDTATGAINTFGAAGLQTIASVFFIALFTVLACLTLLAVAVMLLIRYVFLGILLLLSPIVWLLWIFPGTQHLWQKWWNQFLRWTFFAPIMLFFISLSLYAMKNQPEAVRQFTQNSAAVANVELTFGVEVIGEMVIVIGLVMGGLFAANSLGITFASTAYGWAQSVGKSFGGWVGRKGIQYGTGWLRRKGLEEGMKSLTERTQEWAAKRKTTLGRFGAGWISRGVTGLSTAGGESVVKHYEQQVAKMAVPNMKAALLTATGPFRIALLNALKDKKELGDVDMTRVATTENKALFARFNRAKTFGDIEKAGLMSVEMNEARQKDDKEALLKAAANLMAKFTKKDVDTAAFKDMFSGGAKLGLDKESLGALSQYIASGVAEKNPALVVNIMPKMDSTSRNNFEDTYRSVIRDMPQKIRDDFEKTMANYAVGLSPITEITEAP